MRRLDSLWLLVTLIVAACMPSSQPAPAGLPEGPIPTRKLELNELPADQAPAELKIVSLSPQGPTHGQLPLTIVFNKSLGELGLADGGPSLPIQIAPMPEGTFRWLGRHAVQFVPLAGSFPPAQHFDVTVAGELTALDGSQLGAPEHFSFETNPPQLRQTSPARSTPLERSPTLELHFTQPVELASAEQALSLTVNGEPSPARVFRSHGDDESVVRIAPTTKLPLAARLRLRAQPGITSALGPLPSKEEYAVEWSVRSPTRLEGSCSDCRPSSALTLEANNPIFGKQLLEHLRIAPAVRLKMPRYLRDDDYPSRYFYVNADFQPGVSYRVSVTPGLVDASGESVASGAVAAFEVLDYYPELRLGASGGPLPPAKLRALPLQSLNLKRYRVVTVPLTPAQLPQLRDGIKADALMRLPGAVATQFFPQQKNRYVSNSLPLAALFAGGPGTLAVAADYTAATDVLGPTAGGSYSPSITLQATELALSAKVSREGAWVWVTSLVSNKPVGGARVSVWGPTGKSYEALADPQGFVQIPQSGLGRSPENRRKSYLVAEAGSDWTHKALTDAIAGWRLGVDQYLDSEEILRDKTEDPLALLFTERGVYRPGDKVWLKGIIRQPTVRGNTALSGRKYTLELKDPQDKVVSRRSVVTNAFGTFAIELAIPETARLGVFSAGLTELDSWRARAQFTVAEYRPSEFEVHAEGRVPEVVNGAVAEFDIRGSYLFGGPMGGAEATYVLSRNTAHYRPPHSEGFATTDDAQWDPWNYVKPAHAKLETKTVALDGSGKLVVARKLDLQGMRSTERVRLDVSVKDVSRQALSASAGTLVHPADFYLGLQVGQDGFVEAPANLGPAVIGITPKGVRVSGVRTQVELSRRRYTWAKRDDGTTSSTESSAVDRVVASCLVVLDARQKASCPLTVQESGSYILRATARDGKGRVVRASVGFYAVGAGRPSFRDDDVGSALALVADKSSYHEGDTAKILVKSPFKRARALVSLERASVLWHNTVELTGGAETIDVPILDTVRPNAYVSVHLLNLEPGAAGPDENYRVGYANIEVDREERRLKVGLKHEARDFAPGETLDLELTVTQATGAGAPAELAVYAVDEGVLSLSGYAAPDPLPAFTVPRALEVNTLETRAELARIFDLAGGLPGDKGAAGGGGGGQARADFKQTAYFNPSVVTDSQGRAHVAIKLPDNLTTFRLMAVAVGQDDRYGTGSSNFRVNKPLMARPALPRFLRVGDALEAGVVLSNRTTHPLTVAVSAAAQGVQLRGTTTRTVELPAHGSVEARFAYVANRIGPAKFTFTATSGALRDEVVNTRTVVEATQLETVAAYGTIKGVEAQRLAALTDVRPDAGGVDLSLSTSALVGLDGAMNSLVDYPYLCTEQLSSRLFPLIPLRDLAVAYGFSPPKDAAGLSRRWLARLLRRQGSDGGFSMWDNGQSVPWVSAYALLTLSYARANGYQVDDDVISSGVRYLENNLHLAIASEAADTALSAAPDELVQSAFDLFVLAALGSPNRDALERLYDYREQMPLSALALLSLAGHGSELSAPQQATLEQLLEANVTLSGNRAEIAYAQLQDGHRVFGSKKRTHALVLLALLAQTPAHPLATPLARGLLAARKGSSFGNTQESAFALLALQAYYRAQERDSGETLARVYLGGQLLFEQDLKSHDVSAHTRHLPMANLVKAATEGGQSNLDLAFQSAGRVPLHYETRFTYARQMPPQAPLDNGFFVTTFYQKGDAKGLAKVLSRQPVDMRQSLQGGDTIVVDVVVVNPVTRRNVVIESPLPAGFEAVDPHLLTTSAGWLHDAQANTEAISYRELRDDRALFFVDEMAPGMHTYRYLARATSIGRFVTPPTLAMEMYQPEVFGRTAAAVLTVSRPSVD